MLSRALRVLLRLAAGVPPDPKARALSEYLARQAALPRHGSGPTVAVQCVEDHTYMAFFAEVVRALAERRGASAQLVIVRSISGAVGTGLRRNLARSSPMAWFFARQWRHVLKGTIDRVGYRCLSWAHPIGDLTDALRSMSAWRRARTTQGNFRLEIHDIPVGDLVVDSYLRFRPAPSFDVHDPFVLHLIWQAHRDVRRARSFFGRVRPALYLTTYTTYIEHGVATRAALQAGVRVYAFGNFHALGAPLSRKHWFHTADSDGYRVGFEALTDPQAALAQAERGLSLRLAGGVDAATSYMKTSAYAQDGVEAVPNVQGAVVVFLHDFYDSPHIYADLVFQDFWTWIVCTLETLSASGASYFLKPHPNQIDLSGEALGELKRAYPAARFLSPRITNVQLAEAGMLCGVTVYGTVAHELAYLGVPSIACARHPHHSFGFCRTAHSVDEYRLLLQSPGVRPLPDDEMRRQALAFYYMHNLHGSPEALELRERFIDFWKASHDDLVSPSEWLQSLQRMTDSAGFKACVERLV